MLHVFYGSNFPPQNQQFMFLASLTCCWFSATDTVRLLPATPIVHYGLPSQQANLLQTKVVKNVHQNDKNHARVCSLNFLFAIQITLLDEFCLFDEVFVRWLVSSTASSSSQSFSLALGRGVGGSILHLHFEKWPCGCSAKYVFLQNPGAPILYRMARASPTFTVHFHKASTLQRHNTQNFTTFCFERWPCKSINWNPKSVSISAIYGPIVNKYGWLSGPPCLLRPLDTFGSNTAFARGPERHMSAWVCVWLSAAPWPGMGNAFASRPALSCASGSTSVRDTD